MTTAAGRPDLDHLLKASHIPAGEPIFYLRARDPAAFDGCLAWAAKARALGVPIAVIEQGLRQADAIAAWPTKKLPGADHLEAPERLQLEYQFSRRAWHARDDSADLKIMLAERRGYDQARAELRRETAP
jgi:hypothetical protein